MIDNSYALEALFGKGNSLWREETQHEAMLLMGAVYKANTAAREQITSAILTGPPPQLAKDENDETSTRQIFEMLAYLESEGLPLLPEAQRKLTEIREKHQRWEPRKYPGMSMWVESGVGGTSFTPEDINSIAPEDVPNRVIACDEQSRRYFCEAVGVRVGHEPDWGSRVLDALLLNMDKLPKDAINPILWGIRATLTDNTSKIEKDGVVTVLHKFSSMVEKRPIPSMWSSLPTLLRNLISKFTIPVEVWSGLGSQLASIFEAFGYERTEESRPIEWLHRAINHPYGDMTEVYLIVAQQHVNALASTGKSLALEPHAESFFSHTLAHYNVGSRYGLCLLAQQLSWIEAISPKLAESLYPDFEWMTHEERSMIAWSGYLWNNTLSRRLGEDFPSTYLNAARRYSEFGSQERRGLAIHVSAVFWFHPDRPELLYQFASAVDAELRLDMLHGWKRHLKNAQEETAKQFFAEVLFPYWDWCVRQDFFSGDNGDRERFAFWELVPLSFASFPEASGRAIQWRPSKITHTSLFVRDAVNDSTQRFPNELTELLIALLEFDPYPQARTKEYHRSWDVLKGTGVKRLTDLKNTLAKKGIDVG